MSLLKSDKTMLAAGLMFLVLNLALLAPLSTGGVQDAVDETFATYTKDTACANDDCTEAEAEWAVSTSQRDYSAWTITNVDDVLANGSEPAYTEVGPFTYDITKTNTITGYDETNGTLTYTQVKSHQCAADSAMPCDTPVTQINIGFQPQVIGATGMAINGIMDLTKVAFAAGMMGNDLENMQAGTATAATISAQMAGAAALMNASGVPQATADAMAPAAVANGWFDAFDAYFAAINGSGYNNMSGMGETISYSQAMVGQLANFTDMSMAMNSAMMPTGDSAALTGGLGVLLLAGHCSAYATADYAGIMADAANGFANVGTMQRATIWGYMAMADATTPDFNTTIARDHAVCYGVGGTFLTNGGGDATWFATPTTSVNASARFANMGITIDNMVAMNLLFAGQGTDTPTGLLASNADQTAFGLATFMQMDAVSAMTAFGLDATQYGAIAMWAGAWLTDVSSLPMVLKGGAGDMTASLFVNTTFGAADPINGGFLTNSLNLGGAWGLVGASLGAPAVELTAAQSGNLLYGPLGLTTQTGATLFLFGELSGQTPPIDFTTMQPGAQMTWDASTIAALYGIDVNAASAVRALMMGPIYGETPASFVPGYLMSTFGTTQYLTQPVSAWLFGWHDPVNAFLASGNPMDMTVGWASLDTNETYYGSDGVLNGDGTSYTICTGEVAGCDKGESVLEDGSNELPWHNTRMAIATYGLIGVEYLDGATGGFLTGTDDKVDVSGYAVVPVTCDETGTVEGIPVDICTASVEATSRSIQAKNLKTFTLLDATPSALPIFLGSDITLKSEKLSGLIIAGESTTTFYLDTRQNTNMTTAPEMSDLTKVFTIKSSSSIGAADADTMESSIVTNQDSFAYWTNFDHPVDYITVLFYIGALLCIANGVKLMLAEEESEESNDAEKHDEAPVEIAEAASE
ncbi:MAG: hypothetical protein OSB30_03055 [Candidatus Poseidoniaceae archaeon]|nr:hypothetical protein [Candidatus Poseidoniaceae archaeon]